ncbi:MAG: hypothetical protein RSB76_03130 [Clostridia bacterium]
MIDTIIYLVAVIGIIAVIGSFFEVFKNSNIEYFKGISNKIFDFKKEKVKGDKWVKIDIYINNIEEDKTKEIIECIKNSKDINKLADYVNVYKIFDNK